jgi:two-component system, OmpR family, sensor histidine kinase KdpD
MEDRPMHPPMATESDNRARLRSDLVDTVGHEMRRPLTAILGFTQTLRGRWGSLPPELRDELLARVEDNAQTLAHMVAQLTDYSNLDLTQPGLEVRGHPLRPLVERVVANMTPHLEAHEVRVEVPEGLAVRTEVYAFERILGNLLSNAATYGPTGSGIEVTARPAGDEVDVSVRDHGPGVPTGERERVFERGSSASPPGRGIGLAVVRDLVMLHDGDVRVDDAPGGGAVFTVTLPAP